MAELPFVRLKDNIQLFVCTTFSLPIRLSVETLGGSHSLTIASNAAMDMEYRYLWVSDFISFACIPRSRICRLDGSSNFNFLRKICTVFHSDCSSLYSHQQCKVSFSPHPYCHLLSFVLFDNRQSNRYKWLHCDLDLHFPDD